ncbi:hypothetical protein V8D89_004951 [Ganoderma adspersum]
MAVSPYPSIPLQGDIPPGLPNGVQDYLLFQIDDGVVAFRKRLNLLVALLTTTAQVQDDREKIASYKNAVAKLGIILPLLPTWGVNIAFSHSGLVKDPINGVIIVSADSNVSIEAPHMMVPCIFNVGFQDALLEVLTLKGAVLPGDHKGHEHPAKGSHVVASIGFDFLDGISQPAVKDIDTKPDPGQETVRQGVILCGRENDMDVTTKAPFIRPAWTLFQLVSEFTNFLKESADPLHGFTADLIGARITGRWKSGAPTGLFPLKDNPAAGTNPSQLSNFTYEPSSQDRCPFSAHTCKTNPRADFGPEEAASGKMQLGRGRIFVAYSGSTTTSFQFIQQSRADNPKFPTNKNPVIPALDPIIGQNGTDSIRVRSTTGVHPNITGASFPLPPNWVIPRGGEYVFLLSIAALWSAVVLA